MKKIISTMFFCIFLNSCSSDDEKLFVCRVFVYDDTEYCSVSFYELLADGRRYDGVNLRLTGYLRYDLGSAVLAVDEMSIDGTVITDNAIELKFDDSYRDFLNKNDFKVVHVYGTYVNDNTASTMLRGILDPLIHIEVR